MSVIMSDMTDCRDTDDMLLADEGSRGFGLLLSLVRLLLVP
jgi:hypothetical protein